VRYSLEEGRVEGKIQPNTNGGGGFASSGGFFILAAIKGCIPRGTLGKVCLCARRGINLNLFITIDRPDRVKRRKGRV